MASEQEQGPRGAGRNARALSASFRALITPRKAKQPQSKLKPTPSSCKL